MYFKLFILLLISTVYCDPWGTDMSLVTDQGNNDINSNKTFLLIYLRQHHLTFIDGPRSHHYPTSSEYTRQCLQQYGLYYGFLLGCDRLMRENSEENHYPLVYYKQRQLKYNPPPLLIFGSQ